METEVLRTIVPMRNAEAELRGIVAAASVPPRQFNIPWPKPSGEYGEDVNTIARLDRSTTTEIANHVLPVMVELGFANTILPPEHQENVDALAEQLCPAGGKALPVRQCL